MFEYHGSVIPDAGAAKGMAQNSLRLTLKAADYPLAEGLTCRLFVFRSKWWWLCRFTYYFQFDKGPRHARGQ